MSNDEPPSMRRASGRALASALAALPASRSLLKLGARAPVRLKSAMAMRALTAIASRCPGQDALIETNLGIDGKLRVLVPSSKGYLLYGTPEQNLAERATLALTRLLALRSQAFLDVGANEGLFTFPIAVDFGPARHASIHVFEPDTALFERLASNLARNTIAAVARNMAVSDRVGRQTFYRNISDDLSGSLTRHFANKHDTLAVDMETTALAPYLESENLRHACVKIDVEGAGLAVWNGARAAIDRIDWLIIEIIGPEAEANLPRRIIQESGWHAYYIRDYDLIPSAGGEFDYRAPFYNWLFTATPPAELAAILRATRFRILPRPAATSA